jgi:N-glycosylase/DNA lyase
MAAEAWSSELALVGAGGEPVDLWRSIQSHGLVDLPPMRIDDDSRSLEITLPLPQGRPRTVVIGPGKPGRARLAVAGRAPGARQADDLLAAVDHVLRLDEDMSSFYADIAGDPELAWAAAGAGRLVRSPTVFEEVVKTICTTNCAWSATERMVGALVEHLGEPAVDAPNGPYGRAFPTPEAMAAADESFYRDVVRAGYRGAYLRALSADVASGALDLEALGRASRDELPDDDVAALLLALPGVGPYAAAHIMMLLGRYSRLVLDSWTRPKYASLNGGKQVKDVTIERRFHRYGPYAGLAFWLVLTRDWVTDV